MVSVMARKIVKSTIRDGVPRLARKRPMAQAENATKKPKKLPSPVSLAPLDMETALSALLRTKPHKTQT
jgi:hypothetical protein